MIAALMVGAAAASLDVNCSSNLAISYEIPYYSGKVNCGNLFMKGDIAVAPTVKYEAANPTYQYTLVYISTCSHCDKSWPDNSAAGLVHVHYVAADISAETISSTGDVASAAQWWTGDWPHHGPSPTQHYNFYLFEHLGPTPAALKASACFPDTHDFCSQTDFAAVVADPAWGLVATQYLTGVYYNDTFRA